MMSYRITTNGVFRNYRANLQKNTLKLNDAMTRVETQRNFNSFAEDPAAASEAFQLRRAYWRTGDEIDTSNHVISKFSAAYAALDPIIDGDQDTPSLSSIDSAIRGVTDTAANGRAALGIQLQTISEAIVGLMNSQYEGDYIFAGADGANVPFTWSDDKKTLYYRGVDVTDAAAIEAAGLNDEPLFVDIGLGFREDAGGELIESTGFDMSLSGAQLLGYGEDKNLAVMLHELGDIFARSDPSTGAYETPEDRERAFELVGKVSRGIDDMIQRHVELSTETHFLRTNLDQLESTKQIVNEQIERVESMDAAQAITEMTWAQYCYNAALRIGNNILSQSLIDYMN
jgi:flagellar hook-associated protein 3 FlgL